MANEFSLGDYSQSLTLTDNDHVYPGHVNELRRRSFSTFNAGYYGSSNTDVEIQAAIDAANAAGGGTVLIPGGDWTISSPVNIKEGVWVRGVGYATNLIVPVGIEYAITEGAVGGTQNNWGISDLRVTNQGTDYNVNAECIHSREAENFIIERCFLSGGGYCFSTSGSDKFIFRNNFLTNPLLSCLKIFERWATQDPGKWWIIEGNIAESAQESGLELDANVYWGLCQGNIVIRTSGTGGVGIEVDQQTGTPPTMTGAHELIVSGNYVSGFDDNISVAQTYCNDVLIVGNYCYGGVVGIKSRYDNLNVAIVDNFIKSPSGSAIVFGDTSKNPNKYQLIQGNHISSPSLMGINGNNTEKAKICNNYFYDTVTEVIDLDTCPNAQVHDNYLANGGTSGSSGIRLRAGSDGCTVRDNTIISDNSDHIYSIYIQSDNNVVTGNYCSGASSQEIRDEGSGNKIYRNTGWVTENSGTATILSGNTSVTVTHGLSVTPTLDDISITLGENPTNDPGNIWVSNITGSQFTINCRNDPGASGLDLAWRAEVL